MDNKLVEDYCTFCEKRENVPQQLYYKSDNFFAFLSLGHMKEGYTLIVPNDHYHCMGALPKNLQEEYSKFKKYITSILEENYGPCISYEHGRVGFCNVQPGEQLCYHAHTHIVPLKGDIQPRFEKEGLYPIKLDSENNLFSRYQTLGHYLYYEDNEKNEFMYQINQPIRRQFLRYLVACEIGDENLADWSKFPEYEKLNSAIKKLTPKIKEDKT